MNLKSLKLLCIFSALIATCACDPFFKGEWGEVHVAKRTRTCRPKPPPPQPIKKSGCFPSVARVLIENGKTLRMTDLQVEDKVETVSKDGKLVYTEVTSFLKKQHAVTSTYKALATSANKTIELTHNHLIYARMSSSHKFNPIYAGTISTGYEVLVQENNDIVPAEVINVSRLTMQGTYVPLTKEGSILVKGVLASCYPSNDHDLSEIAMSPLKWFPSFTEWIFGDDTTMQAYIGICAALGRWVSPYMLNE